MQPEANMTFSTALSRMKQLRQQATVIAATLVVAGMLLGKPAHATAYNFDVLYNGGGAASLAGGSDDPTTTSLVAGDTFVYSLTAQNGGEWTVFNGGSIFPFFAFLMSEGGTRVLDFTLDLNNNGSTVFSDSEAGATNQFGHLGTNTIALPTGLKFDQIVLSASLTSTDAT